MCLVDLPLLGFLLHDNRRTTTSLQSPAQTALHVAAIKGAELKHLQVTAQGTLVSWRGQKWKKRLKKCLVMF